MKNYDKFYRKYGVMIPPPLEEEEEEEVKLPVDPSDLDPKWIDLLQEAEGHDPLTEKPAQSQEEILELLHSGPTQDIPVENIGAEQSTVPPKKAADRLLKMCNKYYDICCKF